MSRFLCFSSMVSANQTHVNMNNIHKVNIFISQKYCYRKQHTLQYSSLLQYLSGKAFKILNVQNASYKINHSKMNVYFRVHKITRHNSMRYIQHFWALTLFYTRLLFQVSDYHSIFSSNIAFQYLWRETLKFKVHWSQYEVDLIKVESWFLMNTIIMS
jgi:hypothetical protein